MTKVRGDRLKTLTTDSLPHLEYALKSWSSFFDQGMLQLDCLARFLADLMIPFNQGMHWAKGLSGAATWLGVGPYIYLRKSPQLIINLSGKATPLVRSTRHTRLPLMFTSVTGYR